MFVDGDDANDCGNGDQVDDGDDDDNDDVVDDYGDGDTVMMIMVIAS